MLRSHVLGLLVMLAAAHSGAALAETWVLDPAQSRLVFRPTWEGEPFEGEFRHFSGVLELDPESVDAGRLEVRVDVTSADAGGEDLNKGLARPEWFNFDKYRTAVYVAERIRATGTDQYVAEGTLRLKGIEHRLDLPFSWVEQSDGRLLRARVDVNRGYWRIGEGEWASGEGIGLQVELEVEARFRRQSNTQ
jgi:polyisoprenoid-binding protein YceI